MRLAPALLACLLVASAGGAATLRVEEVRVHGNHSIPDSEILAIAGVDEGAALEQAEVAAVEERLRASGRFDRVVVAIRHRSLDAAGPVVLLIEVVERPSLRDRLLFFPRLDYDEDWGWRGGADLAFSELLGEGADLHVTALAGEMLEASVEDRRELGSGPFDRLRTGLSFSRREHPTFEEDLDRLRLGARLERHLDDRLRLGVELAWEEVELGLADDRQVRAGLDAAFDTRAEIGFPRDAVLVTGGVQLLWLDQDGGSVARLGAEARGYKGLWGASVLALRARWDGATDHLPGHEQPLLGGAATLRGHPAGAFLGDNRVLASVELRQPLTSPAGFGRLGVHAFFDTGSTWRHGDDLGSARFHHGAGVGAFLQLAVVNLQVDVAHDLAADVRVHFSTGIRF